MELGYAMHMHLNTSAVRNIKPDIFHIPLCRERNNMRIVSIFKNGNNRAIRLPRDLDFEGVGELEIVREEDSIILRPVCPAWITFPLLGKTAPDFLTECEGVISDNGRGKL